MASSDAILDEKLQKEIVNEINSRPKGEPLQRMFISPGGKSGGIASACFFHNEEHSFYPKLVVESEAAFILALRSIARIASMQESEGDRSFGCKIGIKAKTLGEINRNGIKETQPLFLFIKENKSKSSQEDEPENELFKASKTTKPAQLAYHCQAAMIEKGYARISFSGFLATSVVIKTLLQLRQDLLKDGKDLLISGSLVASATIVNTEEKSSASYDFTIIRVEATNLDPPWPRQPAPSDDVPSHSSPSSSSLVEAASPSPIRSPLPPSPILSPSSFKPTKATDSDDKDKIWISRKDWECLQGKLALLNQQNKDLIELVTNLTSKM